MNGLIEDNQAPGWLEENPHSIAGHILNLKDHKGKPLSRARLIQVNLLPLVESYIEFGIYCDFEARLWTVHDR